MTLPEWLCRLTALGTAIAVAGVARAEQSETTATTASTAAGDRSTDANVWHSSPDSPQVVPPPKFPLLLALQAFAVTNKVMAGAAARTGRYWGPRFEVSLLGTIDPVAD